MSDQEPRLPGAEERKEGTKSDDEGLMEIIATIKEIYKRGVEKKIDAILYDFSETLYCKFIASGKAESLLYLQNFLDRDDLDKNERAKLLQLKRDFKAEMSLKIEMRRLQLKNALERRASIILTDMETALLSAVGSGDESAKEQGETGQPASESSKEGPPSSSSHASEEERQAEDEGAASKQ